MVHIIIYKGCCFNVGTNGDLLHEYLEKGATELTEEQITMYGMKGRETEVGAENTVVNEDGSVTFTPDILSEEELEISFRNLRDARLASTDKYLIEDFPVSDEIREAVKTYRQALRDMPTMEGFPWDGGGHSTPWPINPLQENND